MYQPQSVFIHDQLYVAMPRVKSYNGLQFSLALPSENTMAMTSYINSVVFKYYKGEYNYFSVNITLTPT